MIRWLIANTNNIPILIKVIICSIIETNDYNDKHVKYVYYNISNFKTIKIIIRFYFEREVWKTENVVLITYLFWKSLKMQSH